MFWFFDEEGLKGVEGRDYRKRGGGGRGDSDGFWKRRERGDRDRWAIEGGVDK